MTSALIVAALVAAIRKQVPQVDGPWVYLVAALVALLVSALQHPADWHAWLVEAGVAFVGAVGGVTLVQRLVDRATWPEAPTSRQSPQAKR